MKINFEEMAKDAKVQEMYLEYSALRFNKDNMTKKDYRNCKEIEIFLVNNKIIELTEDESIVKLAEKLEADLNLNTFSKLVGVDPRTLKTWYESGKLVPACITSDGIFLYTEQQVIDYYKFKRKESYKSGKVIGYLGTLSNIAIVDSLYCVKNNLTYYMGDYIEAAELLGKSYDYELLDEEVSENELYSYLMAITNDTVALVIVNKKSINDFDVLESICNRLGIDIISLVENIGVSLTALMSVKNTF